MIRATLLCSAAILSTISYHISNYRSYFSLSNDIKYVVITSIFMKLLILNLFFHFYVLNMDISLNIYTLVTKFYTGVLNIPLEGSLSQIFYLGLSFYLMIKNSNFWSFFKTLLSRLHKIKTRT